jgi:hypothetical protein
MKKTTMGKNLLHGILAQISAPACFAIEVIKYCPAKSPVLQIPPFFVKIFQTKQAEYRRDTSLSFPVFPFALHKNSTFQSWNAFGKNYKS